MQKLTLAQAKALHDARARLNEYGDTVPDWALADLESLREFVYEYLTNDFEPQPAIVGDAVAFRPAE